MKISILLPTRNRLGYLKFAIESIRRQEVADWEIVISDNDSSDDIAGYVESLADPRIRYARTREFLPVTENWNAALEMSSGEYVVMMGDDDALLPGYLARMQRLLTRFERPDLLYVGSLLFTYPGVDPNHWDGFLAPNSYAEFLPGPGAADEPFLLAREQALQAVRRSMEFRHALNFNMQLSLVSRGLIDRLRVNGPFFQSPFPDFYATCAALLNAERVVVDPREEVIIGVTPKSYGFFHLNDREQEGRAFLGADGDAPPQLPGTNINEGWLRAMERVQANYGTEFGVRVSKRRYRLVQAGHVYTRRFRGAGSAEEIEQLNATLRPAERWLLRGGYGFARVLAGVLPQRLWDALSRRALGQFPGWEPAREDGKFTDILEVFESRRARDGERAG
jgi:glycosyltransferase involved in cell wall biosynthesis